MSGMYLSMGDYWYLGKMDNVKGPCILPEAEYEKPFRTFQGSDQKQTDNTAQLCLTPLILLQCKLCQSDSLFDVAPSRH